MVRSTSVSPILISIHAPTRGATITTRINKNSGEISIHAPTRGATQHPLQTIQHSQYFNPRSHEGSDEITKAARKYNINFNPRSHEGSDPDKVLTACPSSISIHAPTRGATIYSLVWASLLMLFQSTLPRGERPCYIHIDSSSIKFQSTLPRGERHQSGHL